MSNLHVFSFDDEEFVVAESPEDAATVMSDETGERMPGPDYPGEWKQVSDDKKMRISLDAGAEPEQTKTCAEWAAQGRGCLCSTNW